MLVTMSSDSRNAPLSMLGRSLALLNAFQLGDRALTLAQLCRRTGIPKGTAHRLVAELVEAGALERTPAGLRLGLWLFELGQLAPLQRGIRDTAAPFLSDLFEATKETVHLAVLDGVEVLYLQKLDARRSPTVSSRVGGRMPASCTGVGKAILAFSPPEVVAEVIGAGLQRRTPRSVIAPGLLKRELSSIRRLGVATEHEESTVGVTCVAAPVLGADGLAVAAISITGWVNRLDAGRVEPAVRVAALGLTRTLAARSAALARRPSIRALFDKSPVL